MRDTLEQLSIYISSSFPFIFPVARIGDPSISVASPPPGSGSLIRAHSSKPFEEVLTLFLELPDQPLEAVRMWLMESQELEWNFPSVVVVDLDKMEQVGYT